MKDLEELRIQNAKLKVYEEQENILTKMPDFKRADIPTKNEIEYGEQVKAQAKEIEQLKEHRDEREAKINELEM